jgi:hypothetical protein
VEQLLAVAADVDGDRRPASAGKLDQRRAEAPGVVVVEVRQDSRRSSCSSIRTIKLWISGSFMRWPPRGTVRASAADRRAASITVSTPMTLAGSTGGVALPRSAASTAA